MEINYIQKKLSEINIQLDVSSLQKQKTKGFMSTIYSCSSNIGNLIIHLITPVAEQIRQKNYQKIYFVSKILEKYKEISTARVYCFGITPQKNYFTVQEFLPGKILGDRIIKKGTIINRYFKNGKKLLKSLEEELARLHLIKLSGYGFLQVKDNQIVGQYNSWREFLDKSSKKWLMNILKDEKDGLFKKDYTETKKSIENFLEKYNKYLFYKNKGVLIHGDMINPGNVLVNKGKISGIIDFEWAAVGDPAWEFAYSSESLHYYFDFFKRRGKCINQDKFLLKRKLYRVFWLLWGINVHARGGVIKKILYKDFKKTLNNLI